MGDQTGVTPGRDLGVLKYLDVFHDGRQGPSPGSGALRGLGEFDPRSILGDRE